MNSRCFKLFRYFKIFGCQSSSTKDSFRYEILIYLQNIQKHILPFHVIISIHRFLIQKSEVSNYLTTKEYAMVMYLKSVIFNAL